MVDVDQYNEDNFKDDDSGLVQDKRGGVSDSEIEALIQKGNNADALKAVLSSAPIGNKNQDEKVHLKLISLRLLLIEISAVQPTYCSNTNYHIIYFRMRTWR